MEIKKERLLERFLRYVSFDSMSDGSAVGKRRPTTKCQEDLLLHLSSELKEMGLETSIGDDWVLVARLDGNEEYGGIAFMAHVDVAEDVMGNGVKAVVHEMYDGSDIALGNVVIGRNELEGHDGDAIVTSDGTTLLGADDKAGVAVLVESAEILSKRDKSSHPTIYYIFTPDEETGSGTSLFPSNILSSVSVLYTFDGGEKGVVELECFNAAKVTVEISGVATHLGSARGKMKSALLSASKIVSVLPGSESPEATDGYYGYYAPLSLSGSVDDAKLEIYLRDFDKENLCYRVNAVESVAKAIAMLDGTNASVSIEYSYSNMKSVNKKDENVVKSLESAAKGIGIDLVYSPIRGGTDGAAIAEKYGVPSPNVFTGGHNYHSLSEWASLSEMCSSLAFLLALVSFWSGKR